jgi:hypothetical protein
MVHVEIIVAGHEPGTSDRFNPTVRQSCPDADEKVLSDYFVIVGQRTRISLPSANTVGGLHLYDAQMIMERLGGHGDGVTCDQ